MTNRGFTLVEMLVSVAIFSIVMVIALGSLLAMTESDRKAQTLKSVINNLNFSLDSMSRSIRTGTTYHCNSSVTPLSVARDCTSAASAASSFAFLANDGRTIVYKLEAASAAACGQPAGAVGCILRSTDGGATYAPMTASEVVVSSLTFYVIGATDAAVQPKVTILLSGYVQQTGTQTTQFYLQTSATQRLYDL